MSRFTHVICPSCWEHEYGEQVPVKLTEKSWEVCCFCMTLTQEGTYVRKDSSLLMCEGTYGYHRSFP